MLTERHAGVAVTTQVIDVGDEEAVDSGFDAAVRAHGQVDAVFANAAVGGGGDPFSMPTEVWRNSLRVNLDGVFFIFRATLALQLLDVWATEPRTTCREGGRLPEGARRGGLPRRDGLARWRAGRAFQPGLRRRQGALGICLTSPPSFGSS